MQDEKTLTNVGMIADEPERLDPGIAFYIDAVRRLTQGEYHLDLPVGASDEIGQLGQALRELALALEARNREQEVLDRIASRMNSGILLDEILETVYQDFRAVIPYNRIGLALIENGGRTVRSYWAKSDQPELNIAKGYAAALDGSSLQTIITTGEPRILNNLLDYLATKPDSASTRLIVAEGIRSSLTCPLIANGVPIGFIFFSSIHPNAYADTHVDIYKRLAQQLAVVVERGRLVSEITAQKAAIEQQNRELRRLDEIKNTFLGVAAHDLRTPIGTIQMTTRLLLDSADRFPLPDRRSLLEDIIQHTHHMLTLLDNLLNMTQIEAGKLQLERQPFDLTRFLGETVRRHSRMAAPKGTRVVLEPVPPGLVIADSLRLRQVLDNLISNAVKYSPPGTTVTVSAQRTGGGWTVSVRDEGPGITAEDRERIFQDFSRLSARPTGGEKSTGLGLAITHRLVAAHGGQVGVDSEAGQGARFWFTLPDDIEGSPNHQF